MHPFPLNSQSVLFENFYQIYIHSLFVEIRKVEDKEKEKAKLDFDIINLKQAEEGMTDEDYEDDQQGVVTAAVAMQ